MVFVRKVTSKGKKYWILVYSIRRGKKIVQKTRYLGKTLPPKTRLEQIKKSFLQEVAARKSRFFSQDDIEAIEKKKEGYTEELRKLSSFEKKERMKEFTIRFTYDSSKLSGLDITLRQTYLILKQGIIPQGFKDLRTTKELENHEKGIIAITRFKGKLDLSFMRRLHKILFTGVDDALAGKFRFELQKDVKIAGTAYVPPKWHQLKKELRIFFLWYSSDGKKLHPLELASLVHLKLISLQPFPDGNSRLSRLIMNWILWKKKYPLVHIPVEDLEEYYNVLDQYQIEKNERPFIEYIKKRYLNS
ncbi:Fic family protein [Candidatus Woesearchaeota archaeon]|nr:Fic family protein [Candidatus Woesearchaeota archaeon]